jgi:predicted membrane metal-binding protein
MNSYPIIKAAIFLSGGILFSRIANIDFTLIIILAVTCLLISFLIKKYFQIASSLLLFISVFLMGYLSTKNNSAAAYIISQDVYKIKNLTAYGEITDIQLLKEKEPTFYIETDSLRKDNKSLSRKIKLICKIKDTNKKRIDSVYNVLQPGNYLQLTGVYYKGREMRNPGEFDYNKYLNSAGISGF